MVFSSIDTKTIFIIFIINSCNNVLHCLDSFALLELYTSGQPANEQRHEL
jgi:hypothetical protein